MLIEQGVGSGATVVDTGTFHSIVVVPHLEYVLIERTTGLAGRNVTVVSVYTDPLLAPTVRVTGSVDTSPVTMARAKPSQRVKVDNRVVVIFTQYGRVS